MFTDLVGYSARVHADEARAMELLDEHRRLVRGLLPGFGGREIETAGDSFLIEFDSALQALRGALALQKAHADRNAAADSKDSIEVRIGLHVGDIEHREDGGVFGDGVNVAARLEPLAPPGGIAVSGHFRAQVEHRHIAQFRSLGPLALKNISDPVEVLIVVGTGTGTAAHAVRRPSKVNPRMVAGVAATLGVIAAAALMYIRPSTQAHTEPSVAVLPFANLSADKSSDYFVDGVHDAIIAHLARIRQLKVISRTSVMEYRGAARNLKDIGKELGVAHVVEGSVQKAGDRVRVTAQLIRVADDGHLWAETYDRPDADVLAIQSDIAEKVATGTRAALTGDEKERIHNRPTANAEAYDLYLQGIAYERHAALDGDEQYASHASLARAVSLDPEFALAYAALARLYIYAFWSGNQSRFPGVNLREKGHAAAAEALRLSPNLAEAHEAMGQYHYHGHRDYEAALKELEIALRLRPSSPTAYAWLANIRRRQGRWQDALDNHLRTCELDPRNAWEHRSTATTYLYLRRFDRAADYFSRAVALAPQNLSFRVSRAWLENDRVGDLSAISRTLGEIPEGVDQDGVVLFARFQLAMYEKRYAEAARVPLADESSGSGAILRGYALLLAGKEGEARGPLERGLGLAESAIEIDAEDDVALQMRSVSLALLGRRGEAVRAAERAMEILPISRDALSGYQVALAASITYAHAGEYDRAMQLLDELLRIPGSLTAHDVRLDPWWQPLWPDPRFKKLVAEHMPKDQGT